MTELNTIQKEVVNHLIAENEGRKWGSKIAKYIHAFKGRFSSEIPFTFYFLSETRAVMYVYDPSRAEHRSTRTEFNAKCAQKKQRILDITGFFEYLTEHGYIRRYYKGLQGREQLPEHYDRMWRKYADFKMDVMSGLLYVCTAEFTPKLKLYKLWEALHG
jgi:hypothetical protein